jgi:hypothetical protein
MKNDALAKKLRDSLGKNPDATIDDLAAEHDVEHSQVVTVLDSYRVDGDFVTNVGEGMGGGWIAEAEPTVLLVVPAPPHELVAEEAEAGS